MILCAPSMLSSSEQSTKRRSRSENMRNVCSFYIQKQDFMITKHGRHVFGEIHEMRKGLYAFFSLLTMLFGR